MPKIADDVFIAAGAVVIGDVTIGQGTNIWYNCTLRGDVDFIRIGENTNIQDNSVIHVATGGNGTIIGDRVTVGHMALLHACHIGDDAFIGMKACVMDFAKIAKNSMVAGGALMTKGKETQERTLYAGAPAKKMRDLSDDDIKMIDWSWRNYCNLAHEHQII